MHYRFDTRHGPFFIEPRNGRWHVIYNDESLGAYHRPEAAADDLAGGHTFSPSNGVDPGACGISPDLPEWTLVK